MTLRVLLFLFPSALWALDLPEPLSDADFPPVIMEEVELGQLLFWDAELSGNRNISCATCHHPRFGTSDGLSLGIGEGGAGLGPDRRPDPENPPEQLIPRNAPALWNVGADGFTVMFADGRIEKDESRPTGFRTPLEDEMVSGFASLLSAQTMFPVLSQDEMAGHYSENDISALVRSGRITGPDGAWAAIAARIAAIDDYKQRFRLVYPDIGAGRDITFADISNAIAAYMAFDFRSDTAPFDAYLRGEDVLSDDATLGLKLFYGSAGCSACHAGALLTDMEFHAMGDPQLGPGKAERFESHRKDTGRMRVTGRAEDAYAFRTPSLRNVTLTAPYGHAGSYSDLRSYLIAHLDRGASLDGYDGAQALVTSINNTPTVSADAADFAGIRAAAQTTPFTISRMSDGEIGAILAFLKSLEDPVAALGGRMGIPTSVPSGLPVER